MGVHFHGTLPELIQAKRRENAVVCHLSEPAAVKHVVESLGVPHPEITALLVNGQPVDFTAQVVGGDAVDVYDEATTPAGEQFLPLRPPLPRPVRFVLDAHLGVLASYLRLLGFDTLYRNDYHDPELAAISAAEERVLLTRDRGLLKRKIVVYGYCLRTTDSQAQLLAVLARYQLHGAIHPWRRCLRCNGELEEVAKAEILDRLEPKTKLYYDDFQRCVVCKQIYWRGSHFVRLQRVVERILAGQ